MALSKRHLVLAATATTLGIGGVLLPGASAMAATTPDQSVAVAAPASDSTSTTTEAASAQPDTTCYYEWYVDAWGNWYYVWVCV
jgi:hypothetical protein